MKKKVFIGLSIAFAFFVFFFLFGWRLLPHTQQELIQGVFAGQQNFDVVTSSPQVTVQRLHEKPDGRPDQLTGYTKDAPLTLSPEQARKIKDLLKSPSSYIWNLKSNCIPHYGVLFNFQSGGHTVRVALCFKCRIIAVFDGEDDNAKQISDGLFDPMRDQLVAISKTLFPNDKEIQALP